MLLVPARPAPAGTLQGGREDPPGAAYRYTGVATVLQPYRPHRGDRTWPIQGHPEAISVLAPMICAAKRRSLAAAEVHNET